MTDTTTMIRDQVDTWRRRAILEGVVGVSLVIVTAICGLRGETWHAIGAALAGGATLAVSVFTYVRGRQWMSEAARREQQAPSDTLADTLRHPWPGPTAGNATAEKGSK